MTGTIREDGWIEWRPRLPLQQSAIRRAERALSSQEGRPVYLYGFVGMDLRTIGARVSFETRCDRDSWPTCYDPEWVALCERLRPDPFPGVWECPPFDAVPLPYAAPCEVP